MLAGIIVYVACLMWEVTGRTQWSLSETWEYLSMGKESQTFKMVCNDGIYHPNSQVAIEVGNFLEIDTSFPPDSLGDCSLFFSYDVDSPLPYFQWKWFKLSNIYNCHQKKKLRVYIPKSLPPCDHCLLRLEFHNLREWPNIGILVDCLDISLDGDADPNSILPNPLFHIPGHIPPQGAFFRNPNDPNRRLFIPGYPIGRISHPFRPIPEIQCVSEGIQCDTVSSIFYYCNSLHQRYGPYSLENSTVCVNNQFTIV